MSCRRTHTHASIRQRSSHPNSDFATDPALAIGSIACPIQSNRIEFNRIESICMYPSTTAQRRELRAAPHLGSAIELLRRRRRIWHAGAVSFPTRLCFWACLFCVVCGAGGPAGAPPLIDCDKPGWAALGCGRALVPLYWSLRIRSKVRPQNPGRRPMHRMTLD